MCSNERRAGTWFPALPSTPSSSYNPQPESQFSIGASNRQLHPAALRHECLREPMLRHFFLIVTVLLAIPSPAQDRSYGRSMVVTNGGIAATSQYLASQAGADILHRGGSAIDAA